MGVDICPYFSMNLISKMSVKTDAEGLRTIKENNTADLGKGFPTTSISKPYCSASTMPTACESTVDQGYLSHLLEILKQDCRIIIYLGTYCLFLTLSVFL